MSGGSEPERSIEVERVYDVAEDTPLPDWTKLPGVTSVDAAEQRSLDARYYDTSELTLALARVAVRRRTGGPDAGWHVKSSAPEGRHEWRWPLGVDADDVPADVAAAVATWAAPPFVRIARIRNARTAYALRDASGALVAEMVDDRVRATADRDGRETAWREWEVELGPAASPEPSWRAAFFAEADALVEGVGGSVSASTSKLGRALGA